MLNLEQQLKILDVLQIKKAIDQKDFELVKKELIAGKKLFELDKNINLNHEVLATSIAETFNLSYIDLRITKVKSESLKIIPEDVALNYEVVVFGIKDKTLQVALVDPTNLKAQEAMDFIAREKGWRVEYYIISKESLNNVLKQYNELKSEVSEALDIAKGRLESKDVKKEKKEDEDLSVETMTNAPIAKLISVILKHAVDLKASDVHIEPFSDGSRVRYRIDGQLQTSLVLPKYVHAALVSRVKVLSNLKIDETRIPQDGRIRLNIMGNNVDFRVSTLPLFEQEKVVMRILDTSSGAFSLEQLGFEGRNLKVIQENIQKPHGMFLVTGPTGSGKSTTLYSVLNILNQEDVNITTLEDPVEYYLTGVNQSQIRPEVGLTFAAGLRSILRQDPDVVMVGEIRDNETAELAIHASLTGHIVLSTLHTNDSFGSIPRLIDMHVEPFLLASTLNVIIAQRLVRKICADCKQELEVPENIFKEVEEELKKIPKSSLPADFDYKKLKFYQGKGCDRCGNKGYKGRISIAEVLAMTDNLKNLIAANKLSNEEAKNEFLAQGMMNVKQDGILKALKGLTTIEEVLRATRE
ncbi:MAG TPA: GspE/PulE family protein [bacterium]|nr:GspE/PulE family protein [bacterium]